MREESLLGYLEETFYRHTEESDKQREEAIIRWKNEYSSDKIPEHMKDEFSLPWALYSLVRKIGRLEGEVVTLRNQLRDMEDGMLRQLILATGTQVAPEQDS